MTASSLDVMIVTSCLVPVGQPPHGGVPAVEIHALQARGGGADAVAPDHGNDGDVGDDQVVHPDEERGALDRVHLRLGGAPEAVVVVVAKPRDVAARPLVLARGDLPRRELRHEDLRVRGVHRHVVHLQIGVEVRVGVGVGRVGREEHRSDHRLELELDAGARARLLDDGLRLLAGRVDRRLVDEPQPPAILAADTVASASPAVRVQNLVGAIDAELPARVPGVKARWRVQEVRRRLPPAPVDLLLDGCAVDEHVERRAHGGIGQRRVRRPGTRALAVDLAPGIRVVELDVLGVAGGPDDDAALAALLEASQDVVLDLQVPRVVVLAGLQDGARRGRGIAAAFHLDGVEERAVGHVIGRVELAAHGIAGLELDEPISAGADGTQVRRRLARLRPFERLEDVLGDDHAAGAAEGVGPERCRPLEHDLDGVRIEPVHTVDLAIRRERPRGGGRVGRVLPVEDDVVGGQGLAVVPDDAFLEVPDHPRAVARDAAVVHARQLRRQHRHDVAVGIEGGQRLVEDARRVLVLGARREVWIQQRGRLPPEDLQRSTTAAPRRRERRPCLRVGACDREELGAERSGDTGAGHETQEAAPRQATASHVPQERAELRFAHVAASMRTPTSIASIMLSGLARPFHARSNAVP
jgi:hypothetical protein